MIWTGTTVKNIKEKLEKFDDDDIIDITCSNEFVSILAVSTKSKKRKQESIFYYTKSNN